jgi:hypothetical protein
VSSVADTYQFGAPSEIVVEAVSTENIAVQVVASLAGVAVNPTALTVDYAFISDGAEPGNSDWHAAAWSTSTKAGATFYSVLVPVATMAAAEYDLWLKIVDGALVPVHYVGRVMVR